MPSHSESLEDDNLEDLPAAHLKERLASKVNHSHQELNIDLILVSLMVYIVFYLVHIYLCQKFSWWW